MEECKPTWSACARMIAEIIKADPKNEFAFSEIIRMGQIIDQHEQKIKEISDALATLTYMEA